MTKLTLAEQLVLLATDDEKGSVLMSGATALPYGIAGALLFELHLQRRIMWQEKSVVLVDRSDTGSPLANEALGLIAAEEKPRDTRWWISRLHRNMPRLRDRVFQRLVEKGILKKTEKKFLWVFPYARYPEQDPQPERRVREMLRDLLEGRISSTERLLALLSLVRACDLVTEVFGKGGKREKKKRIDAVLQNDRVGKAVSEVVAEVNTAVMAAISAAVVASSAANH